MKRGTLVLFSIFVILMLSLGFVSANWFSEVWSKVTGQAIEQSSEEGYCSGTPTPCTDITSSSLCQVQSGCSWKTAEEKQVITASAIAIGSCSGISTPCSDITSSSLCQVQSGCSWISESIKIGCIDSDGGKNYYVKGSVKVGNFESTDVCSDNNIIEYFCFDENQEALSFNCPYGCLDGACVIKYQKINISLSVFLIKDTFRIGEKIMLK